MSISTAAMAGDNDEGALTVPKFSSFKSKGSSSSKARGDHDDGSKKPVVPKFSSFKSKDEKASSSKDDERHREGRHRDRDAENREDRKRRHRSERSERERDHHESKRRRHDDGGQRDGRRRRSRSPRQQSERPRKPPAQAPKDIKSDLFFVDTKGDPLITKYGGIERSKIPAYRRYGGGRVLGTIGRLIIHREGARDQFSLRMPGDWSGSVSRDGLRVKKAYLKQGGILLRPYKPKASREQDDDDGFLRLGKLSKDDIGSDDLSDKDDEHPNYRSIDGKAKAKSLIDSDSSDQSDSEDDTPLEQSNPLKWRSIQLNRRVKDSPEDIDAWTELADHQDTLLRAGQAIDSQVVQDEVHSFTEIKVSMLESALEHTVNDRDRWRVLNYLMREGPKVWSGKTTAKRWQQLHADEEKNFLLWRTHLDFEMSNIASFTFDATKNMLLERKPKTLSHALDPSQPRHDCFECIYVFLRLTRFIHDAGFRELAVAAWQAVMEMTFFRPPGHEGDNTLMGAFQDFWESEVPRIGEADAQGWRHYVETEGAGEPPEPLKDTISPNASKRNCKSWSETETRESQKSCLPSRTMDEGNDDDPYRVVMFSDIDSLLFTLIEPDLQISRVRHFLLDAFLIFCGLPPVHRSGYWTELAWQDPFLTGARSSVLSESTITPPNETEETTRAPTAFKGLDIDAVCEPEILFPGDGWFDLLDRARTLSGISHHWVQLTLRQLVLHAGEEHLATYYLALSTLDSTSSLKKTGKSLLRRFPNSPELYRAYALAEYSQGNKETAVKVLESATTIFKIPRAYTETDEIVDQDGLQLWQTWAWIDLDSGNKTVALKRLCSAFNETLRKAPDSVEATSTHTLVARNDLNIYMHDYIAGYKERRDKSYILLEYLMEGEPCEEPSSLTQGNISAAMHHVDRMSRGYNDNGEQDSAGHESLLQFAARLLYLHATRGPFRREYMRKTLLKFQGFFPRNTIILSLLEWSDSSLRVIDETRNILHDNVLVKPHDCPTSRLFAIHHEVSHGNVHSTRTAYENAVASDPGRSNPQIWISYIKFCGEHREMRGKGKDVFYRALRHCPWSKEVMMEAFVTLGGVMDEGELRSVYRTMEEKGLRVHVDLQDYLKGK